VDDFTADQKVVRYVLIKFREQASGTTEEHLAACPETTVSDLDAANVGYGCDTGCDYTEFNAVIECPHSQKVSYTYGDFGDLAGILTEIEEMFPDD
jgi:hypothetical protein